MKITISSGHKEVPVDNAESGKAYVVTVDMGAATANRITDSLCRLWNNTVAVAREEYGTGKRELIRVGGGETHNVAVGSVLSRCFVLTEIRELNVAI